jgi:hypothetical protein
LPILKGKNACLYEKRSPCFCYDTISCNKKETKQQKEKGEGRKHDGGVIVVPKGENVKSKNRWQCGQENIHKEDQNSHS